MASKIFFSHQKVYFWISAFDHRAILLDKMHIVHWRQSFSDISIVKKLACTENDTGFLFYWPPSKSSIYKEAL